MKAIRSSTLFLNFADKEFEVDFDYEPEEKEVRYDSNGTGHPGCPAEIIINGIKHNDEDWTDFIFEYIGQDQIEDSIWESLTEYRD